MTDRKPRILLGLTGSVAAVKWEELALELSALGEVAVVHTNAAQHFMKMAAEYAPAVHARFQAAASDDSSSTERSITVYDDEGEWRSYQHVHKDPVLHIQLRNWADVMVIAPLSANTLSKLAHGGCDNLLTSVARAWEFAPAAAAAAAPAAAPVTASDADAAAASAPGSSALPAATSPRLVVRKPIVVAPAMNTAMWGHPVTAAQIAILAGWGYTVVGPVSKLLACGDVGTGAMESVGSIMAAVKDALAASGSAAEP